MNNQDKNVGRETTLKLNSKVTAAAHKKKEKKHHLLFKKYYNKT